MRLQGKSPICCCPSSALSEDAPALRARFLEEFSRYRVSELAGHSRQACIPLWSLAHRLCVPNAPRTHCFPPYKAGVRLSSWEGQDESGNGQLVWVALKPDCPGKRPEEHPGCPSPPSGYSKGRRVETSTGIFHVAPADSTVKPGLRKD